MSARKSPAKGTGHAATLADFPLLGRIRSALSSPRPLTGPVLFHPERNTDLSRPEEQGLAVPSNVASIWRVTKPAEDLVERDCPSEEPHS